MFRHAADSFNEVHRGYAVPYWTSIPLPMQTMGPQYVAWKAAAALKSEDVPQLTETMRDAYRQPVHWPHPRLRALRQLLPPERTIAPWLAPSNPWWPLEGPWRDETTQPRKALVFSRFRAVPQSIAASLSFDLEARYLAKERAPYSKVSSAKLLTASEGRHALLALFHPSPLIIEATDPLVSADRSASGLRQTIQRQLREMLKRLKVTVDERASRLPLWKLLARLEVQFADYDYVGPAWAKLDKRIRRSDEADGGLGQLLDGMGG